MTEYTEAGSIVRAIVNGRMPPPQEEADILIDVGLLLIGDTVKDLGQGVRLYKHMDGDRITYEVTVDEIQCFAATIQNGYVSYDTFLPGPWQERLINA